MKKGAPEGAPLVVDERYLHMLSWPEDRMFFKKPTLEEKHMKHFCLLLRVFNPFIFLWNMFSYMAHLETYRYCQDSYEPYNFSKDIKYF
jgi:hypothetical protein